MADGESTKECPECGSRITWRNAAVRCLACGRQYCKECPDYSWGRFQVRCPDCDGREARPLENGGGGGDEDDRPKQKGLRPSTGRRMGRRRREGAPKPVGRRTKPSSTD